MKYIYKSLNLIVTGLIIILGSSCSEPFDYEFENQVPLLVVEGKISNQPGPYYVRLSESISEVVISNYSRSHKNVSKAVPDALVRLNDGVGDTEILRYIGKREGVYPETEGWYIIENISGVVGRSYTLTIEWKGKTYISIDKMEAVPVIDKIGFRTKHLAAKNEDVDIPLIYFREPQDIKNYYLMYFSSEGYFGSNRNWVFSILNDDYLEAYVDGLEIDDGQSPSGQDFYMNINSGVKVDVYLESLSEPAYDFYRGVIDQFDADGGAFSPSPASPPSNISGGALGLFRASAVSIKTTIK